VRGSDPEECRDHERLATYRCLPENSRTASIIQTSTLTLLRLRGASRTLSPKSRRLGACSRALFTPTQEGVCRGCFPAWLAAMTPTCAQPRGLSLVLTHPQLRSADIDSLLHPLIARLWLNLGTGCCKWFCLFHIDLLPQFGRLKIVFSRVGGFSSAEFYF
jgi:hypothetical protein